MENYNGNSRNNWRSRVIGDFRMNKVKKGEIKTCIKPDIPVEAGTMDGLLSCPDDYSGLDRFENGIVRCSHCERTFTYEEESGIWRLLPIELAEAMDCDNRDTIARRAALTEMSTRDRSAISGGYDRKLQASSLVVEAEVMEVLHRLPVLGDEWVLDLGCGTGRALVPLAKRHPHTVGADFSHQSLVVARSKLRREDGLDCVGLAQADMYRLPLRRESFGAVVSCQVLSHVPDFKRLDAAFREIHRILKPGGLLVFTAYNYSIQKRLFGLPRDWVEAGSETPFIHFTPGRLKDATEKWFSIEEFRGVQNFPMRSLEPWLKRLRLSAPALKAEKLWQKTPMSKLTGHLVLVACRKRSA